MLTTLKKGLPKTLSFRILLTALFLSLTLLYSSAAFGAVWYVRGDIGISGTGTAWSNALKTIQEAVDSASTGDEIWIKKGTYLLSSQINVDKAVGIYGGFNGSETKRDERDWKTNVTTIDGEDTVYHCFYVTEDATIDGLTITGGNADGSSWPDDSGGGIYVYQSSPNIANCIVSKNSANFGGGIFNNNSSPTITNCSFTGNIAVNGGGGIYNEFDSSPTIDSCILSDNSADFGGGVDNNESSPTITNCTFTANSATKSGGGMYNDDNTSPAITNCTLSENSAQWGGGIFNDNCSPTINNCTVSGNTAVKNGGGIRNFESSSPTITNCILWANTAPHGPEIYNDETSNPIVTYCDIQGGFEGQGNVNSDPLFFDPSNSDFHLTKGSPCIDTGSNSAPGIASTDFDAEPRIVDGDSDGSATVDMGVDEYTPLITADGDVAPLGNRDGTVNVGDALVALRFALGLETPTQEDISHGDVAPLSSTGCPNPDGNMTVGDALVILRLALGLINFSNCVDYTNHADWTYMVYMGADNNLSTAGLLDLNEMESAGSDEKVKIVLQAEFSSFYTNFDAIDHGGYQGETLRFLVQNDGNPDNVNLEAGQSIGNVDMGSSAALTDFIKWAATTYPAEHYALVIWDHGAGWKKSSMLKGAVQDLTSNSFMSLPQLATAVRNAKVYLDVINFDACLMAMYEVAYEFLGLVEYMVFSEEVEPGTGDPYDTILTGLKNRPGMTGLELSGTIVEKYYEYFSSPGTRQQKVTKSAVDMSLLPDLHTAMLNFAEAIVADYDTVSGVVAQAQANAQRFEYAANLDLHDFSSRIANGLPAGRVRDTALMVNNMVTKMVIANRTLGAPVNNAFGLAIFVPAVGQVSSDTLYNDLREYNQLACNQVRATAWSQAVEKIVAGSTETLHPGGLAFYISWDTDADLDLYVWEPNLEIYAPWMGQTTPNGYFSADSLDVEESVEYYVSNDYVQPGDYHVWVEYYSDGLTGEGANVEFWYLDPDVGDWQMLGPVWLDLSAPCLGGLSDIDSFDDLNACSNYWYTGDLTRAMPEEGTVTINTGRRQVNFHVRPKKRAPQLNEEIRK